MEQRNSSFWFLGLILALWVSFGSAVAQQTPVARYNTVADMLASPVPPGSNTRITALVTGRVTANDGGGGTFFYYPASSDSTNLGTIFKPNASSGRWIRSYDGNINALWFGADRTGASDSSVAINAAIALNEVSISTNQVGGTVDLPPGQYVAQGITLNSTVLQGGGFAKTATANKTLIRLPDGATNDCVIFGQSNQHAPGLVGISLLGYKEHNIVNPVSVVSASDRYNFNVGSGNGPTTTTSTNWPYYGFAFIFSDENRYVGLAAVTNYNSGTGDITLADGYDWFAAPAPGGDLPAGWKVMFSQRATNALPSWAGGGDFAYNNHCIGRNGVLVGSQNGYIHDCYINGFHAGIATFSSSAIDIENVWIENCSFAGIANKLQFFGADNYFGYLFIQGIYSADPGSTVETNTLAQQVYRSTGFGLYEMQGVQAAGDVTITQVNCGIADLGSYRFDFDRLYFDVNIVNAWLSLHNNTVNDAISIGNLTVSGHGSWSSLTNRLPIGITNRYAFNLQADRKFQVANMATFNQGNVLSNAWGSLFKVDSTNTQFSIANATDVSKGYTNWFTGTGNKPVISSFYTSLEDSVLEYGIRKTNASLNFIANSGVVTRSDATGVNDDVLHTFNESFTSTKPNGSILARFERTGGSPNGFEINAASGFMNLVADSTGSGLSIQGPGTGFGSLRLTPNPVVLNQNKEAAIWGQGYGNVTLGALSLNAQSSSVALNLGSASGQPGPTLLQFFTTAAVESGVPVRIGEWRSSGLSISDTGTVTTYPSLVLALDSTTRSFGVPSMTTVQRDAIASPANRSVLYNSTTEKFNGRQGGSWGSFLTDLDVVASTNITILETNGVIYISSSATSTNGGTVGNVSMQDITGFATASVSNPTTSPDISLTPYDPNANTIITWDDTAGILTNATVSGGSYSGGVWTFSGGSGSVTNFQAGNFSPLFTTGVGDSTTYPSLTFSATDQGATTGFAWNDTAGALRAFTFGSGLTYDTATDILSADGGGGSITPVSGCFYEKDVEVLTTNSLFSVDVADANASSGILIQYSLEFGPLVTGNDAGEFYLSFYNNSGSVGVAPDGFATDALFVHAESGDNTFLGGRSRFTNSVSGTTVTFSLIANSTLNTNCTIRWKAVNTGGYAISPAAGFSSAGDCSGGGGGGVEGTIINSGGPAASTDGAVPYFTGTTGTNALPSGLIVSASTNLAVGNLTINGAALFPGRTLAYTGGTNVLIDLSQGSVFGLTLTNTAYMIFTNVPTSSYQSVYVQLLQDGTGGRSVSWLGNAKFPNAGLVPTITTNANAIDVLTFVRSFKTTTNMLGVAVQNFQ